MQTNVTVKAEDTLIKNAVGLNIGIISYQVIQEFINVATHKFKEPLKEKEWCQVNYFSWMDSWKVTRAQDKVKGTSKWQINYLTPTFERRLREDFFLRVPSRFTVSSRLNVFCFFRF